MCRTFSHKTRREVKRLISVFFELLNNGSATCCLAFILFLLILVVFLFFLSVYSLSLSLSLPPSLTRFSIPPRFIISRVRQSAFKRTKKKNLRLTRKWQAWDFCHKTGQFDCNNQDNESTSQVLLCGLLFLPLLAVCGQHVYRLT